MFSGLLPHGPGCENLAALLLLPPAPPSCLSPAGPPPPPPISIPTLSHRRPYKPGQGNTWGWGQAERDAFFSFSFFLKILIYF